MDDEKLHLHAIVAKENAKQLFCTVCKCWIPSVGLVNSHISGKKHRRLEASITARQKLHDCSLYVRGFPAKLECLEDRLKEHFAAFGNVQNIYVDKNQAAYAIVIFCSDDAVARALALSCHNFCGQRLIVKPRKQKSSELEVQALMEPEVLKDNLKTAVESNQGLTACCDETDCLLTHVKALMAEIGLRDNDLRMRQLICDMLQSIFEEAFSACEVQQFGSTVTGLGETDSDLDVTLLLDLPSVNEAVGTDPQLLTVESRNDPLQVLSSAKELIQKFAPGCQKVVLKPAVFCPIVSFYHTESKLNVDLSLNNRLALRNTLLLRQYFLLDPRGLPLVFVIKRWAKVHKLIGYHSDNINSYALTLMVIHFLMQVQPPVLCCLQELVTGKLLVDGWDCKFALCCDIKWSSDNRSDLGALLRGFFEHFLTFDFTLFSISISSTCQLTRQAAVEQVASLGKSDSLRCDSAVLIQDPFRQSQNVAQNMSPSGLLNMKLLMRQALVVLDHFARNAKGLLLTNLFAPCASVSKQKLRRLRQKDLRSEPLTVALTWCRHASEKGEIVCFNRLTNIFAEDVQMEIVNIRAGLLTHGQVSESNSNDRGSCAGEKRKLDNSDCPAVKYATCENLDCTPLNSPDLVTLEFGAHSYVDTWTHRRQKMRLRSRRQDFDIQGAITPPAFAGSGCHEKVISTASPTESEIGSHGSPNQMSQEGCSLKIDRSIMNSGPVCASSELVIGSSVFSTEKCHMDKSQSHADDERQEIPCKRSSSPMFSVVVKVVRNTDEPCTVTVSSSGFISDINSYRCFLGYIKKKILSTG